jgi:uncharacterized protein
MTDPRPTRRFRWGAFVLGVAVVGMWLASPDLPSPARLLAVVLVTFLPALLLLQGRMLRDADLDQLPRMGVYLSSSLSLWVLAVATVAIALTSGFTLATLGLVPLPPLSLAMWSVALVAAALAVTLIGQALGSRETALLAHLLPRTRGEKLAWVGVSVTAGVCEELVFRSFLIPALHVITGSLWLAALLSSGVFGFLHGYQGVAGIVRTAVLGLVLAVPFLLTGSIIPSMIAHFAIDVIAGIWLADWLLRRQHVA